MGASKSSYVFGKRIAHGGMAEIFLGKVIGSEDFQKLCAIKRILPHYAQEAEYVEMFRSEASICKRLQHANIVQVFDFKKIDDSYAIIMEFVEGTDLRSLLAACEKTNSRMTVPMAVYVGAQIARGLHYAHTRVDEMTGKKLEIIHRDISPQNILLSFEGEVKVIDFGIAKFESRQQETKPGVVKGKYSYMSPEQVSAKILDARTDVFSLSIVLWEMLGMRRLFAGENDVETIKNVQGCIIRKSLLELNPSVSQDLHQIVLTGLAKDRKNRYANAAQMEKELMSLLNRSFPEFHASELGGFIKQQMAVKKKEVQEFINELMTASDQDARSPRAQSSRERVEFSIDPNSQAIPIVGGANALTGIRNSSAEVKHSALSRLKPDIQSSAPSSMPSVTWKTGYDQSRNKRTMHPPGNMQPNSALTSVIAVLLALLALAGMYTVGQKWLKNFGSATTQMLLDTRPANVTIDVDGKPVEGGTYIETPRRLSLPRGKHSLTISRENYTSRRLDINGQSGDLLRAEGFELYLDPKANIAPLSIETNNIRVYIVLDNGYHRGFAPTKLPDIAVEKNHTLTVFPNYPQKRGGFSCNFVPTRRTRAVRIQVAPNGLSGKCSADR